MILDNLTMTAPVIFLIAMVMFIRCCFVKICGSD